VAEESASPNTNRLSVRIAGWLTPQRFLLLLVLFSTFIVYVGTLEFGFVYDDHELIVENAYVHSWAYLRHYFREPMWRQFSSIGIQNYYRPLLDVWLRINHALFGVRSWGWHLTSVLAHIAATWLVYALVRRLTNEGWTAILAGMIFGLHPAHTEAVAWISGVAEPLAALCLIPAFLCYLRQRERTGKSPRMVGSILTALCAGHAGQGNCAGAPSRRLRLRLALPARGHGAIPMGVVHGAGSRRIVFHAPLPGAHGGLSVGSREGDWRPESRDDTPSVFHDDLHLAFPALVLYPAPALAGGSERVL
jgi:hypothetical protein